MPLTLASFSSSSGVTIESHVSWSTPLYMPLLFMTMNTIGNLYLSTKHYSFNIMHTCTHRGEGTNKGVWSHTYRQFPLPFLKTQMRCHPVCKIPVTFDLRVKMMQLFDWLVRLLWQNHTQHPLSQKYQHQDYCKKKKKEKKIPVSKIIKEAETFI